MYGHTGLFLTLLSLSCFGYSSTQDLVPLVLEITRPDTERTSFLQVGGISYSYFKKDSGGFTCLVIKAKRNNNREVILETSLIPELPNGVDYTLELIDQYDQEPLSTNRLEIGAVLTIDSLPDVAGEVIIVLREDQRIEPASVEVRVGEGIDAIKIGEIHETRSEIRFSTVNISARNIFAIKISLSELAFQSRAGYWEPLLQPDNDLEWKIGKGQSLGPWIEVIAVVFEDGTFEGNLKEGLSLVARRKGRAYQLKTAFPFFKEAMKRENPDAAEKWLRAHLSSLQEHGEFAMISPIVTRYQAPGINLNVLTKELDDGMKDMKETLLQSLEYHGTRPNTQSWLAWKISRYEKALIYYGVE